MAKKKKCIYDKVAGRCPCQLGRKRPNNVNSKCEIIPPKPKVVKIKCYAYIGSITGTIMVSNVAPYSQRVPCVAYIKEADVKYLKGAK